MFVVLVRFVAQELGSCWDGRPFGHCGAILLDRSPSWHLYWTKTKSIDIGRKAGDAVLLFRGGAGSHPTLWPGPRPTCIPSGILIHTTVWPKQTWAENWGLCHFGRA